jgi:hypothetical protein
MKLFHGSTLKIVKPEVTKSRKRVDFGQGFYTTIIKDQAIKWAKNKAKFLNEEPIVSVYDYIPSDKLNILDLDKYNEKWLDIVANFRRPNSDYEENNYDIIFGKVANDQIAQEIDAYISLLIQNRVTPLIKQAYLEMFSFAKNNNQYCFKTNQSLNSITFLEEIRL